MVKKSYIAAQLITWPRPDLNVPQAMAEIEQRMAELERKHPGAVRFTVPEFGAHARTSRSVRERAGRG